VELGVSIKNEFAERALSASAPIRLGERCTVFMERDVFAFLRQGAELGDLVAGLAYSVVQNYINRVVRGRPIDGVVFFQGGTSYNDAVAAAFAAVLDREVVVPPHNGVLGAIGAAFLAQEWADRSKAKSGFRGCSLDAVRYSFREFTCKGCQNYCNMQEFSVEGEKSYWGDQCSDRYRKRQKTDRHPVISDLFGFYLDRLPQEDISQGGPTVGLPRSMYMLELLPFWVRFFESLGWSVIVSPPTTKEILDRGVESTVAEPCLPIQVAHGHVAWLMDRPVDLIFLPAIINRETMYQHTESYVCVWGQTLPSVLRASHALDRVGHKLVAPILRFREGKSGVIESLARALARFGVSRRGVKNALRLAEDAQRSFVSSLHTAGRQALDTLHSNGRHGIILVGRPYNIYDRRVNLDVVSKLRDYYGSDVIPLDFLELDTADIRDINANMYWSYGRRIIAAARQTESRPFSVIYLTNFKCGPDSFIKHYVFAAGRKPFLTLQFDGHANDAGILTRCEAFLESKGILRPWSGAGKSSCHKPEAA
jgi:predicted nucleotide-binding protein (sugar kinase/HSP70/actin superfamily)